MLPIRTRTIFRNRWWTLAWAAGICWTAIDFAGSPSDDPAADGNNAAAASGAPVSPDADAMRKALATLQKIQG